MKSFLSRKINFGFLCSLIILLAAAYLAYSNAVKFIQSSELYSRALVNLTEIENIEILMLVIESSKRGYLYTKKDLYFTTLDQAEVSLEKHFESLEKNITRDSYQSKNLAEAKKAISEKLSFIENTIAAKKENKDFEVQNTALTGHGNVLMDKVKRSLAKMKAHEKKLLSSRLGKVNENIANLKIILPTACLIVFFLVLISGFCLNKNIDKLEEAERNLHETKEAALESSRHKSEFLANMSHEIRTPLNGIIGMTDLLLDSRLDEEQDKFANIVKNSAYSLLAIINDILDFSKIESGKLSIECLDFSIVAVVENALELLTVKAKEKGLSLMSYIDPRLPIYMKGDPGRIGQILINLIGNAVKFTAHGGIVVKAYVEDSKNLFGQGKIKVLFSVIDTGIGIPKEAIAKLFNPFVQADSSTARKFGGTGLGLSISKKLIDLMDGEISVDSVEGKGSTFSFIIPLEASESQTDKTIADDRVDLTDVKLLIVDNDSLASEIFYHYAESWGIKAKTVCSGKKALLELEEAYKKGEAYNIALVDYMMPGMDGFQFAAALKEDSRYAEMKLILITAFDEASQGRKALDAGFTAYLTKPIKQAHLFDTILKALNKSLKDRDIKEEKISQHGNSFSKMSNKTHGEEGRQKKVILIAEDNPVNQMLASMHLNKLGYNSHSVNNGREALEALANDQYDLILMDCQMPEMDGYQATKTIRRMEGVSLAYRIPIVAMTANAMQGDEEKCLSAGMDDYLAKPMSREKLAEKLEKWLGNPTVESAINKDQLRQLEEDACNEWMQEIVSTYLAEMDENLKIFQEHLLNDDFEGLAKHAHYLKSSSASIGAHRIVDLCKQLEEVHELAKATSLVADLEKESRLAKSELAQFEKDNA